MKGTLGFLLFAVPIVVVASLYVDDSAARGGPEYRITRVLHVEADDGLTRTYLFGRRHAADDVRLTVVSDVRLPALEPVSEVEVELIERVLGVELGVVDGMAIHEATPLTVPGVVVESIRMPRYSAGVPHQ